MVALGDPAAYRARLLSFARNYIRSKVLSGHYPPEADSFASVVLFPFVALIYLTCKSFRCLGVSGGQIK